MTKSMQAFEFGSPGRTRTNDQEINSLLLYQLSYRGIEGREYGLRCLNRQTFYAKKITNFLELFMFSTL